MTQVVLVSSRATECFHGLELPTRREGFGINWRAILWEGRCSAPTPSCLCGLLSWPERCPGVEEKCKTPASMLGRSSAPRRGSWKQPVETPGGKPQDEAPRGASLHPAPSLAELSEQVPSRSRCRVSHHPCHARPGSETLARTELRQPVPLQWAHAALPSPQTTQREPGGTGCLHPFAASSHPGGLIVGLRRRRSRAAGC